MFCLYIMNYECWNVNGSGGSAVFMRFARGKGSHAEALSFRENLFRKTRKWTIVVRICLAAWADSRQKALFMNNEIWMLKMQQPPAAWRFSWRFAKEISCESLKPWHTATAVAVVVLECADFVFSASYLQTSDNGLKYCVSKSFRSITGGTTTII